MENHDVGATRTYHNATKHSPWSIRATPHYLDWDNQPLPFKVYPTLDPIPLDRESDLGRILYFSAGITKKKVFPGGEIYFRAASCTGAMYEIELYVVREDGVYHFSPGDFSLRLLRAGDYRCVVGPAPMTIVCTGTYWRNAWKYRTRTYRHFGWDNGTILANVLAMTEAIGLPAKVMCGFVDSEVNRLLDLDTDREVAFSMVEIGESGIAVSGPHAEIPKLNFPTVPLSESEVDYPELRAIHEASSLVSQQQVNEFRTIAVGAVREAQARQRAASRDDRPESLDSGSRAVRDRPYSKEEIEQVILRRGSTRQFARVPISREQLSNILQYATQTIPTDFGGQLNDLYLIVNAVDGLEPGAYFYHRDTASYELLKAGNFRDDARYLGLGQDLPGDASAAIFLLADLNPILARLGNRGYRAVQLEAGIIGGRMYLSSYAQRLGATGLTFFDDDVTNFFSPHAQGKSAIFLMAVGKSRTKIAPL